MAPTASSTASQTVDGDGPKDDQSVPMEMEAPLGDASAGSVPHGVHLQAVNDVLYSEVGINALLTRLKQSLASANDFASFLKKRSTLERDHAEGLKKLSKSSHDAVSSPDGRQGTYVRQVNHFMSIHDRISDSGLQFAGSLQKMHDDLSDMTNNIERDRKRWKHEGLTNEKRVKDAEGQLEKAKARYDSAADSYDRARTGDSSGRTFGIKGPKSAEQREEDLLKKLHAADSDYHAKVDAAQSARSENTNTLRPQAIKAIQELITECDGALTLQLQKYAAFVERLLVSTGLIVSPMQALDDANSNKFSSLRGTVQGIDNERDFHTFVTSYSASVPPKPAEIKYERHPTLGGPTASVPGAAAKAAPSLPLSSTASPITSTQNASFNVRPGASAQPLASSPNPSNAPQTVATPTNVLPSSGPGSPIMQGNKSNTVPSYNNRTPGQPASVPSSPGQGTGTFNPPQYGQAPPRQQYSGPQSGPPTNRPAYQGGPRHPSAGMQNGPNGSTLAPTNPVFGLSLDALFRRDESAVPLVVYQCIQAVDLFGLEVEGIYRLSGNSQHIQQLRAAFDHDSTKVDFRNPSAFHHDVNSVAGLLKAFFRDLPDPLLTRAHYNEFIEAAKIDDDILRRDSLHSIINGLPDPNYATLRALVLHLNRVQERSTINRMTSSNLAICFAPTMMGPHRGPNVADSGLQTRVVDTILQNTYQIFDED